MDDQVSYFGGTYDETMTLLIEARNYAAYRLPDDQSALPTDAQLQVASETLRVVSRLIQVMAWLLALRAVQAGEMTPEKAASAEFAIDVVPVCFDSSGPDSKSLPNGLCSLLDRSHRLYHRALRLEAQVRRKWKEDGCEVSQGREDVVRQ